MAIKASYGISILGVKPVDLAIISKTFVSPWGSAQATLDLVNLWNRMDVSGFTFQQIAYLLYEGLHNIDSQNPNFPDITNATPEAVTGKVQQLFGTDLSAQILGFLEGTLTFSTNAPKGLSIVIPPDLATRVKYADGDNAKLQVTGQLTAEMTLKIKALSPNPKCQSSARLLSKIAGRYFSKARRGEDNFLAAIPQIIKKSRPEAIPGNTTWKTFGEGPMAASTPIDYWEIKMGYTELRNGKWTQKIITTEACYEDPLPKILPLINSFQFVPRLTKGNDGAAVSWAIDCVRAGKALIGTYTFDGKLMRTGGLPTTTPSPSIEYDTFEYSVFGVSPDLGHVTPIRRISSLQADGTAGNLKFFNSAPAVSYPEGTGSSSDIFYATSSGGSPATQPFNHQFVHELMSKVTAANSVDGIYAYFQTLTTADQKDNAFGQDDAAIYSELKRPYSLYNWEIGFHMPMALANSYLKTQQFDLALKMCNYVFDPFYKGTDEKRFWRWPPFRGVDSIRTMEKLFDSLQPENPVATSSQINQWRDNPFSPHVIARLRPVAYMKWAVMKYIEILIAYGDYYFTQNTLEMIPMAIQCYILASHIYGKRGQKIPKRGKTLAQTYKSLGESWDPFGNAIVPLELMFPFSNQTDMPVGMSNGVVGLANIFGFATTRYFCIPDNPQLAALRDKIDDRLFKIRHCQDIFGNVQHLPLYEPSIDPSLLVSAAAQGLSIASVLSDLDATMPNYRFPHLFIKAIDLCGELKSLGNALLDRSHHGMDDKKMALDEAQKSLDSLLHSRSLPAYKMQHYLKLLGLPTSGVPTAEASVVEIDPAILASVDSSGYKLIPTEKEEVDKASDAADWQRDIGILETIASVFHVIPSVNADGKPLGIGGTIVHAADLSYQSTSAGRNTNFLCASHDRVLNANSSAYKVKNIDKQIITQNIRIAMADHGILVQQQLTDNSEEILSFLKNKYTNQELYIWMQSSIQDIYHQLYNMAHDWAKKAEKAYRLERGVDLVVFSPDGTCIASGSGDGMVMLWDAKTGALQSTMKGHSGWVESVAFSPDGTCIASGSSDGMVMLWMQRQVLCRVR
ncbi:MAG: putative Insecticidal toxin complex protein TccB2 [Geoglossum umbratile]|nr:MAG: putative Insecticidal toxin complex protein TccB2 [Geoglossum umbratile]